jgi:cell division protein FtsB
MKKTEKVIVRRSKKINQLIMQTVLRILDSWSGRLTWNLLIDAVAKKTYQHYTRQTLADHREIQLAFQLTKERLSVHKVGEKILYSPEDIIESQRNQALRAENERLKAEIENMQEKFNRWAVNAFTRKGMTEEMLDEPLQKVRR